MLFPSKTKYKKVFRGKIKGNEYKVSKLVLGSIGIKALKSGRINSNQLEFLRKTINKKLKGKSKVWIRIYPSLPVTAKPTEVRMGKGKGSLSYWCCPVNAGRVLFEFQDINKSIITEIVKICNYKLSLPIKLIVL